MRPASSIPPGEGMPASGERFAATRWSLVAAAVGRDPGAARRALIELCLRYWFPVYAYVRGCGHAPAVAQDITRAFFEDLLHQGLVLDEVRRRGRFRQFLLDSLNRFLNTDWRQAREQSAVPEFEPSNGCEELEARHQRELVDELTPEQVYQRNYALEVLAHALARLRREADQAGRLAMFEAMEPLLGVEPVPGQIDELSRALNIRPLAAVVALKRLRQRYRELAESELAETVVNASDLDAEREALARALGQA